MIRGYELREGAVVPSEAGEAPILVFSAPDEAEKQQLLELLRTDRHSLDSALDPEEISRVEVEADHVLIVWKRPDSLNFQRQLKFDVSSIGILLQEHRLIVVMADDSLPFALSEQVGLHSLRHVLLHILLRSIHHYVAHLKVIKHLYSELQTKLQQSMENEHLLQMFSLSESLIYYLNALSANQTVLQKLQMMPAKLNLSHDEAELLEDVFIENTQCLKQAEIYSQVLSGLMDARGNIINNNMNVLIRNLTVISIIFLPLNLIASIGGMSEFTMMTAGVPWWLSYSLLCAGMGAAGWLMWVVFRGRMREGRGKRQ